MGVKRGAIVTGGVGDIGLAIARRLQQDGWRVGLLDLDKEAVARAVAEVPGSFGLTADVTDEASCQAAVARFGDVDGLVNNAGTARFGALHELATADFRKAVEVNLIGPYIMAKACVTSMMARRNGVIINITSIGGITPNTGGGSYAATKAGLARLTEQMALEWGPSGIRANAVAPGFIDGGLSKPFFKEPTIRALRESAVPLRRLGQCEDVAEVVAFLMSERASYVTGQEIAVDGGIVPSVLLQLPRELKDMRR